jgi:hypothetical protein
MMRRTEKKLNQPGFELGTFRMRAKTVPLLLFARSGLAVCYKVEGQLDPVHAMKAYREGTGIAPLIVKLGTISR